MKARNRSRSNGVSLIRTYNQLEALLKRKGTVQLASVDEDGTPDRSLTLIESKDNMDQADYDYQMLRDDSPVRKVCLVM